MNFRVVGVAPCPLSRQQVAAQYRTLARSGRGLRPAGRARHAPEKLLKAPFIPRHAVSLFAADYLLTDFYYIEDLNFFVGYVFQKSQPPGRRWLYPRIFYKDSSLIWRVASHIIDSPEEQWIGKGDVIVEERAEGSCLSSDESSTNLPYEIQSAFDVVSRRSQPRKVSTALGLVLRNAPPGRMHPYADFSRPRRRAAQLHNINSGRPIVRLTRRDDPGSLKFAKGFEPDFDTGLIETGVSRSNLYGGEIFKHRIRSTNNLVQYQFVESPTHLWINPPQAFDPAITSYGVRALHIQADEDIFIPGFEFHFMDDREEPPELFSQIPAGWAGAQSTVDPFRADASPWINALPVIQEFRRRIIGRRKGPGPAP
ncbi:MAG: hypothetical protein R3E82_14375 [Pseudomonadales bacterium]